MNIATGITTSPRQKQTLTECLSSITSSGLLKPIIFSDDNMSTPDGFESVKRLSRFGPWKNWYHGVSYLANQYPMSDAYLMIQDDGILSKNIVAYLINNPFPKDTAIFSLYCPSIYRSIYPGWFSVKKGYSMVGAVAIAITKKYMEAFLKSDIVINYDKDKHIDGLLGKWAEINSLKVYYHFPSLVQHIGETSTIYPRKKINRQRRADSFIGNVDSVDYMQRCQGIIDSWSIGPMLIEWIHKNIPIKGSILELGSGKGTGILASRYKIYSIEHNKKWLGKYDSYYIYAPIKNGWYDAACLISLPKHDMLLIDGPPESIGREGILKNLDLFDRNVSIVIDDVHRQQDLQIATKIATVWKKRLYIFDDVRKKFAILS